MTEKRKNELLLNERELFKMYIADLKKDHCIYNFIERVELMLLNTDTIINNSN